MTTRPPARRALHHGHRHSSTAGSAAVEGALLLALIAAGIVLVAVLARDLPQLYNLAGRF